MPDSPWIVNLSVTGVNYDLSPMDHGLKYSYLCTVIFKRRSAYHK